MSDYVYNIIEEGEHEQLDFKFEVNDPRKIAITLSSFSNTKGGKLLIGVKDNGKIRGIKTEEEFYMLDLAASLYCRPPIELKYSKWTLEGKTILEVDVPEGKEKPYYAKSEDDNWLAYFRQRDQNHLANIIQLKVWQNDTGSRAVLLKYSKNESLIMKYLSSEDGLSLKSIVYYTKMKRGLVVNILSKLTGFGLIEIRFKNENFYYHLKDV